MPTNVPFCAHCLLEDGLLPACVEKPVSVARVSLATLKIQTKEISSVCSPKTKTTSRCLSQSRIPPQPPCFLSIGMNERFVSHIEGQSLQFMIQRPSITHPLAKCKNWQSRHKANKERQRLNIIEVLVPAQEIAWPNVGGSIFLLHLVQPTQWLALFLIALIFKTLHQSSISFCSLYLWWPSARLLGH